MAIDNFIPEIWANDILVALRKNMVYGSLVNRDYQGEISAKGDTVRISAVGTVTIGTYTKNTDIADAETLSDAQTVLTITQSPYFNFQLDDIDNVQMFPKILAAAMEEASYKLKDAADLYIAGLYGGASASNKIGDDITPKIPNNTAGDAQNVYKLMLDCALKLDEANVPTEGRWIVVPPWLYAKLLLEGTFVDASKSGSTAALRQGEVGQICGFTVFKSNNVPNTDGALYKILFGNNRALTYAEQISKIETYRLEKRFASGYKGLHLYGAKVVRPDCLGCMTASKA